MTTAPQPPALRPRRAALTAVPSGAAAATTPADADAVVPAAAGLGGDDLPAAVATWAGRELPGGHALAVVGCSWDNATEVTDVWGSAVVPHVVAELAARVRRVPDADVRLLHVTPLGGTLAAVSTPAESGLADAVAALAEALRRPVAVGSARVWPVVTVAARHVGADDDPADVVADVRTTVSHTRRLSPGALRWHRPGLDPVGPARLRMVTELAEALAAPAQFGLAFQPLRDLATGRVVAAEALLRWVHPRLGPQPALPTVEMAERSGLMPSLGRVVLDGALAAARAWSAEVVVHANVSAHELREPGYVDGVHDLLARHRVAPGRLLLELTESALATGPDSVVPVLEELVAGGVRLGLDDFGTGWSSIAQLRASPVDTVKVDRSLTAGIGSSPEEFELVRAVLALVEAAGREVVAEGVEDAVQLAHLRALGCRVGQGHHLGRPQPARALIVD